MDTCRPYSLQKRLTSHGTPGIRIITADTLLISDTGNADILAFFLDTDRTLLPPIPLTTQQWMNTSTYRASHFMS